MFLQKLKYAGTWLGYAFGEYGVEKLKQSDDFDGTLYWMQSFDLDMW